MLSSETDGPIIGINLGSCGCPAVHSLTFKISILRIHISTTLPFGSGVSVVVVALAAGCLTEFPLQEGPLVKASGKGYMSMQSPTFKGTVYIVGAAPGSPELLNGEAEHLLRTAEVVLHDDAVPTEILDLIPASTQVRNVCKLCAETEHLQEKIDSLLIAAAREGHQVVRLIASEPSQSTLVGREAIGLVEAGIEVEYIPGAPIAVGAGTGASSR